MEYRIEKDSLGEVKVPNNAWWGVQTQRAVENFPVSGRTLAPEMVWAMTTIKKAAALVHEELGLLESAVARAIVESADQVLAGEYNQQFVVDIYQAGAGTSHHMNINEVLANRANEILGARKRGEYKHVHPNDHVNFGQSTNDVIPTCIRLAALSLAAELIAESMPNRVQGLGIRTSCRNTVVVIRARAVRVSTGVSVGKIR